MMKQPRRTLWQRFTAFWDHLFLLAEKRLTESLHDWVRSLRHHSDKRSFSKVPLLVEALEPRWLLTLTAGNGGTSILHGGSYDGTSVILDYCYDSDGLPLSISSYGSAAHGSVTMTSDGSYDYHTPNLAYVGTDTFTYTVTDGTNYATGTISINVTDQAPVVYSEPAYRVLENRTLTVNDPMGWNLIYTHAYDPDGDALTASAYNQPSHGSTTVNSNGTFTYTPSSNYVGSDSFTYWVSDGAETATATAALTVVSDSTTFSWSPTSPTNPSVTPLAAQTNVEGAVVVLGSLNVTASDPHGYTLQYAAINLPPGLSIDSGLGYLSGTVAAQAATYNNGVYDVTLIVTNDDGGVATAGFTWTITSAPPTLDNPGAQTNYSGDSVSLPLTASQLDSDPLSFAAVGLPADLSIDPDSGVISGDLALSDVSTTPYSVTVTVTDYTPATPTTASKTFNWSVAPGTPSPSLTNPGNQANVVGDDVDVPLDALDLGGYPLTFTASGLPSGLTIDPGSGEITGTLPNGAASGTPYNVTVTASDGQVSTSDSFTWTVGGVSLTNPGDQLNLDSTTVSLALSATDASSTTLTYSASGLPSGLSIDSSTGVISGTFAATGNATVTVAASDGTSSDSQTFNWEVDRFAFDDPANQVNREGSSVSVTLTASDAAGTPTFSASGLPSGLTLNATTGVISGTLASNAHVSGPYQVTVTAGDGSASISQSFVWSVTPQIALVNPGAQGDASGDSVSLAVTATDFASGTLAYSASSLPTGLTINSSSGVISGTVGTGAVSASPYEVTVTAGDGTYSYSQMFPWTVSTIYLPEPADQANLDSDTVSLSLAAAYHGSGTISYSATGIPDGLSLNTSTGLLSGTLTNTADADGPYTLALTATDGSASTTVTLNWEVDPRVTVDALDNATNVTGDSVSLTVTAEDAGADSPTWTFSASGLPSGLSINSSTGVISGTITAAVGTSDTVTVAASDGTGSASTTFDWNVVPVILSAPDDQASVGSSSINLALSADVASGYSASGLPPGLSIDSSTGVISGTLSSGDTGNTYLGSVSATAGGVTSSQEFLWQVGTVVLTPPADQTATEGDSVSFPVSAVTLSGTLTYSASDLPAGLSINSATGVISGTLSADDAANGPDYQVTVIASNGTVADSQTFDWTVNPKVIVTALDDQLNLESDTVSLAVTASEAGATLSYSATGLPGGLTINSSTGVISGTVSTGDFTNGPYEVDVTVSDGTYSSDVFFGWTIHHGSDHTPVLTNPGTQASTVGDDVNLALSATDADSSDTLSYSAVGLPDGLDIDPVAGVISGSVAEDALQPTPYSVTVTVDDGNGGTTTQTFNWIVNDSALTVTGASLSPTEGVDTGDVTVATFTDTDPNWDPSAFTATITWGDGSSDVGEVDGSNGVYTVTDDHIYNDSGTFTVQVSVTDGFTIATGTGSAVVGASSITVNGGVVEGAVPSTSVTGTWASFTDSNPQSAASSYTAIINWGDGSATATATVTGEDGLFVVSDAHTYAAVGAYTVTVTVRDKDGSSDTTTSTAQVGDLFAGDSATMTVATFTVSDTYASPTSYTAVINWGDGSSDDGTITGSGGVFTVQGTHTYAVDSLDQTGGVYTVTVKLIGPNEVSLDSSGNETITATTTESVVRPPITGYADEVLTTPSLTFNGEVGTFTELDDSDSSSEFTAVINWGDGSATTTGTVTGSDGLFHVLGSHSYSTSGTHQIQVGISQAWSSFNETTILQQPEELGNDPFFREPAVKASLVENIEAVKQNLILKQFIAVDYPQAKWVTQPTENKGVEVQIAKIDTLYVARYLFEVRFQPLFLVPAGNYIVQTIN